MMTPEQLAELKRMCEMSCAGLVDRAKCAQKSADALPALLAHVAELETQRAELVKLIDSAVSRVEKENARGQPILSGWLVDARAAIAKAGGA